MTFEEYLKSNYDRGIIDFQLCCYDNGASFFVWTMNDHDANEGEILYFKASGNTLDSLEALPDLSDKDAAPDYNGIPF